MGWLALAAAIIGVAARHVAISNHVTLIAAVASPLLMLGAPVAGLIFAIGRLWRSLTAAVAVVVMVCAAYLPLFLRDAAPTDAVAVRVMTANIYFGLADADAIAAEAVSRADIFAVQELTPASVSRLEAAGINSTFPYHHLDARDIASGVGIWSRFPIVDAHRIDGYELAMVGVRLDVDGVKVDPTVLVAHLSGPWPQPIDTWRHDIERMPQTMQSAVAAAAGGCVLVAGDFNSTIDMKSFRHLLEDQGFADAAEQAGAGMVRTYPANTNTPPLIGIDHVLTSHCSATRFQTAELPGSDHRGVVTEISVPRSAAS